MIHKLALQRLLWKDLRLALPLVALLIVLGVLTQASLGVRDRDIRALVFEGLPLLFAVGGGALLIGREKEHRTLLWLSTLPISVRKSLVVKLLTGLLGLALMWVASLTLWTLANYFEVVGRSQYFWFVPSHPLEWTICLMNTLFILLAGVLFAWQVKSALVGLLAVFPAAWLPSALAGIARTLVEGSPARVGPDGWLLGSQIICSVIALCWGWRAGLRCMGPETPHRGLFADSVSRHRHRSIPWRVPQPSFAALIWQYTCQTRAVIVGSAAMLVAALILVSTETGGPDNQHAVLAGLLALLAVSWLGAAVFLSDRFQQRIDFLAVRGVSAAKTWMTRQAIPLSVVVLASLLFPVAVQLSELGAKIGDRGGLLAFLCIGATVGISYSICQWSGQTIRSPIVAAVAAPGIAAAALAYAVFATSVIGTPFWLFVLVGLLPLVATFLLMRRWMDARFDVAYWATHAGCLLGFITVPMTPLCWTLAEPTMPSSTATELIEEAQRYTPIQRPQELVLGWRTPARVKIQQATPPAPQEMAWGWHQTGEESESASPEVRSARQMAELARELTLSTGPLLTNGKASEFLIAEATLAAWKLDADQAGAESIRRLRDAIKTLIAYVKRLRPSYRLLEQDVADQLEIWLLRELHRPHARERLGEPLVADAVQLLADSAGRDEARRRAIALSWREYQRLARLGPVFEFGGYRLDKRFTGYTMRARWTEQRRLGRMVSRLWQMAAPLEPASAEHRHALADFWHVPASEYGFGRTGPYLRADDLGKVVRRPEPISPATQWGADWERQAAALKST